MTEDYVRPPIVAQELPSQRASIWRFRVTMGALLLLLVVIIVWVAHAIVSTNEGDPTVLGHWNLVTNALR